MTLIEIGRRNHLVRIDADWIPFSRRFLTAPKRRFRVERALGRVPMLRRFAAVLAVEARRDELTAP